LINRAAAEAWTKAPFLTNGMVSRRNLSPGKEKICFSLFIF
jgi:hypothetical protein